MPGIKFIMCEKNCTMGSDASFHLFPALVVTCPCRKLVTTFLAVLYCWKMVKWGVRALDTITLTRNTLNTMHGWHLQFLLLKQTISMFCHPFTLLTGMVEYGLVQSLKMATFSVEHCILNVKTYPGVSSSYGVTLVEFLRPYLKVTCVHVFKFGSQW